MKKEHAKKRAKENIRNGILILIVVLVVGYFLVAGVWELLSTKKVTVQLTEGAVCTDVDHSTLGFIPFGEDHYFTGKAVNGDKTEVYVIRAGKKWADKTFDKDGKAEVTGLKKRFDDDAEQQVSKNLKDVEASSLTLGTSYYLDINYKFPAVMKIIAGVLFLAAAVTAVLRKLFKIKNKVMSFLPTILVLAGLAVALFGIR